MRRACFALAAALALPGCFVWGSCPDDLEPIPLESGTYVLDTLWDQSPAVEALFGEFEGDVTIDVDLPSETAEIELIRPGGEIARFVVAIGTIEVQ